MLEKKQKEQMRICHISTVHPSNDVRIFYRECSCLIKAGFEVHLVISENESTVRKGVHIHAIRQVKSKLLRMLFMPWVAMRKALQTKSSIYHYHDPELLFMGFVLRWAFGKKVVFDIHESIPRQIMGKPWLPKWSRKPVAIFYKFVERIFTNGQALVLANLRSVPDYPPSAYVVRNYPLLDEELIAEVGSETKNLEEPSLIYLGGVWESRGALLYVELAKRLLERGHSFRMQIIGPYTEKLGKELKSKIEKSHLQDKVLLTGRLDWVKAMKLVSQATIGMCLLLPIPNYDVILSTKILEYMMVGTPVLASNFEHWRSYVEGERTGMMADPANIDEVIEVCEKMLSNPGELTAMGKRGMEAVRTKYNWDTEFKVLLKCYEKLRKG